MILGKFRKLSDLVISRVFSVMGLSSCKFMSVLGQDVYAYMVVYQFTERVDRGTRLRGRD